MRTNKIHVLLDCDEVLGDFLSSALPILSKHAKRPIKVNDLTDWDLFSNFSKDVETACYREFRKKGFCKSIKPFKAALTAMPLLQDAASIYIVTSPLRSTFWHQERIDWLKKYMNIKKNRVILTSAKYMVDGDIFVDDKPDNVRKWAKAHPTKKALLWDRPFNRDATDLIRVKSWKKVLEIIEQVRNERATRH